MELRVEILTPNQHYNYISDKISFTWKKTSQFFYHNFTKWSHLSWIEPEVPELVKIFSSESGDDHKLIVKISPIENFRIYSIWRLVFWYEHLPGIAMVGQSAVHLLEAE